MSIEIRKHAVDGCDPYSRIFRVYVGERYLCQIRTAVSHCCGMNSLENFNVDALHKVDVTAFLDKLYDLQDNFDLPWATKDFIFFSGENDHLDPLIDHEYTSPAFTFPSRSGYGELGHPVTCYKVSLP
jgi:hypothetical protein